MSDLFLRTLLPGFLLFQEINGRYDYGFAGQIEQWVFAVKGELSKKPAPHKAISAGLDAGCRLFQKIILLAVFCAVGKGRHELLHPGICQILIGITRRHIALPADIADRLAVRASDDPHIRKIGTQLLDRLICTAVGVAHSLFKLCGHGNGLGSKIYYIRLTHCFALPPSKIRGVWERQYACFFFWKKCVKLLLGDCLFFVVGIGL